MANPVLTTDDNETKAKKWAASMGLSSPDPTETPALSTPSVADSIPVQANVSSDTAAPIPVIPNPADSQTSAVQLPAAGLTPKIPDVSSALVSQTEVPANKTEVQPQRIIPPATTVPSGSGVIQDAATGQALAAGSGAATGGFTAPTKPATLDPYSVIDQYNALNDGTPASAFAFGPKLGLTMQQLAANEKRIQQTNTTLDRQEKVAAMKDIAAGHDRARRDAAETLAESRRYDAAKGGLATAQQKNYEFFKKTYKDQGMTDEDAHKEALKVVTEGKSNPTHEIAITARELVKAGVAKSMDEAMTMASKAHSVTAPGTQTSTGSKFASWARDPSVNGLNSGIPNQAPLQQGTSEQATESQKTATPAATTAKEQPPTGFKSTGRTSGGREVFTDGKRYWVPGA